VSFEQRLKLGANAGGFILPTTLPYSTPLSSKQKTSRHDRRSLPYPLDYGDIGHFSGAIAETCLSTIMFTLRQSACAKLSGEPCPQQTRESRREMFAWVVGMNGGQATTRPCSCPGAYPRASLHGIPYNDSFGAHA
jgi:hypothetical protein